MLSECGVENYSKTNREDLTAWAKTKMQMLYEYVPMVFPEIKGMFYFDFDFEQKTSGSRYALYANADLSKLYGELTAGNVFLAVGETRAKEGYRKLDGVTVAADAAPLYAYVSLPEEAQAEVEYSMDGKTYGVSREIPYHISLNLSGLSDGEHTLKAELRSGGKLAAVKTIAVQKKRNLVILTERE